MILMAKKHFRGLEDLGQLVFSTGKDRSQEEEEELNSIPPGEQLLEAHFGNKGRGGRTVTVVKGFKGKDEELKALGKMLKTRCGVGGSVKEGEIIIQGNYREKIMQLLKDEGYKVKRVGG